MRKIIVQEFITLDGVMQAPGGPEEDETGSFQYGGWTAPYFRDADDSAADFMQEWMRSTDILLGRRTYELFESYWPKHTDMWPGIMDVTKYCVSSTLEKSDKWPNSVFIKSIDDIKKLKEGDGSDIKVHGSGKLAQALFENDLVDELYLQTFPIILGKGKRLFSENSVPKTYKLTDSIVTPNGVIMAKYIKAGEVETGTVGE